MKTLKQGLVDFAARIYFKLAGSPLRQTENADGDYEGEVKETTSALLRRAAAEGAVLLKNDGVLPVSGKIALFGRAQNDTFYSGYGSGGNVAAPYRVNIAEGLRRGGIALTEPLAKAYADFSASHRVEYPGWGSWPHSLPEMPLSEELVRGAREETETAVVVIGRASGEDRDHELTAGSYYLTREEERMLALVRKYFSRVAAVLNTDVALDFSFCERHEIGALLLVKQGGMEAGNACADLLTGKISPCGKLADTVAMTYADYPTCGNFGSAASAEYCEDIYVGYRYFSTKAPEKVLYPFGFGLSYTRFETETEYKDGAVRYRVKNVGERAGKEVVQVYVRKPHGGLGNPERELIGFRKTALLSPGEEEEGTISLPPRAFCSYDPLSSAYVRCAGEYRIFAGTNVRDARKIGAFTLAHTETEEKLRTRCAPRRALTVQTAEGTATLPAAGRPEELRAEIEAQIPTPFPQNEKKPHFSEVRRGEVSLETFVASLTLSELEDLAYGALKMNSPLGAAGNAGVMGGVSPALRSRGVLPVTMTDGPSGIRLKAKSSLLPVGALLACTFDPGLVEEIYAAVGEEMKERGSDVLLAPALNLHRDPLCGRNFEYYSEDPLLSGKMAAAAVRGVQKMGVSACPKHFACNNQEFNRSGNDSRLSERALRELYLRGFEICVKEGKPRFLMTSYNLINGERAYYGYELIRGILRGEWGFDGCVVTDWWMRGGKSRVFKKIKNNPLRVRSGVNVLMPGGGYLGKKKQHGGLLKGLDKKGRLTLGELQRNACEVLGALLKNGKGTGDVV